MRPRSASRAVASIGTRATSCRIMRSISRRCRTITSFASVHTDVEEGIVDAALRVEWRGEKGRQTQQRVPIQMRARRDLRLAGSRRQHPHGNLQSPSRWVDDTDCAVSEFWSTDDAKTHAMKRVERVEDADVRGVCAQGIVGAGGSISICTVSSPAGRWPGTVRSGSPGDPRSCFRSGRSRPSFARSISPRSSAHSMATR